MKVKFALPSGAEMYLPRGANYLTPGKIYDVVPDPETIGCGFITTDGEKPGKLDALIRLPGRGPCPHLRINTGRDIEWQEVTE